MSREVDAPHHPALAQAHRTLKAGSPVPDALIAEAVTQARETHAELVETLCGRRRRVDPRTTHLGEAVDLMLQARPRTDEAEAARTDLALAVAGARTNDFVLEAVEVALRALERQRGGAS